MADPKYRTSCDACLNSKVKCSQTKPSCWRCTQQGQECIYSQYRRIGRPPKRPASALAVQPQQQQQQQRVTSDMAWKQKQKQKQQQQQQQRQQHPSSIQHQTQPQKNDQLQHDVHRDSNDSSMAIVALATKEGNIATPEPFDISTSNALSWDAGQTWSHEGSPSAQDVPESFEFMANLGTFDYDIPVSDFADLSHIFNSTSNPLPTPETLQPNNNHDDTSSNCQPDPYIISQPTSSFPPSAQSRHSGNSPTAASAPSPHTQVPTLPLPQPAHSTPALRTQGFNSRDHRPFPHPSALVHVREYAHSLTDSSSLGRQQKIARSQTGNTSKFRKFPLPSNITDVRCSSQCHATLTEQLSRLNEFHAHECRIPLDVLLNLDAHVRREREKALRCSSCLGKTRSRQTLTLIIMVLENLLSLFEREFDIDQVSSAGLLDEAEPCSPPKETQWRHDAPRNASPSPLPQTSQPLIVGDFEVDESVKAAFSRQLLRMHFEAQMATVAELGHILDAGTKDVSYKVAWEILVDIYRRVAYFQGFLTFMD